MKKEISICWLRRDLRLRDNAALYHSLTGRYPVLPVFIFDTLILDKLTSRYDKRVAFIHHALLQLDTELKRQGSALYTLHGTPLAAFKKLTQEFEIREVYTNHDYEPYAIERDAGIADYLSEKNISFYTYRDQVVFERSEVVKNSGAPYTVFTPYSKAWKKKYEEVGPLHFPSENLLEGLLQISLPALPGLSEIGFEKAGTISSVPVIDEALIKHYDIHRNFPALDRTTHLSAHLRFGTVSIRELVQLANRLSVTWLNELIWREFFMMILFHFPYVTGQSFKKGYDRIRWRNDEAEFERWCRGETGYPMVDAGMRQLNETGWMHNRVRMIVASFLTRHLLIDWRWGEAYFAEKLLDYELASNNGNWQWAAGSGCDAAPYFRIFNPLEQARKFDPGQAYVKTWIKNFHPGYLAPMVEHEFARKRALDVYKTSLAEY